MGVSGCGKTSIGKRLAEKLDVPFYDGDDFHPKVNVEKMKSGKPLNDEDRYPWLKLLANQIGKSDEKKGGVYACSALKQAYRDFLADESNVKITFVYLKGDQKLIADRLSDREGHYMPAELLDSQFQDLEEPTDSLTVSINQKPDEIVKEIMNKIQGLKSK